MASNDWYPNAIKKQINGKTRSRDSGTKGDALIMHIAVSNSSSLYSFFSNPDVGCSHFYIRKDGEVEQYLPISSKSSSEKQGNTHTISVETQGGTSSDASQAWTDAQVETAARIFKWLNDKWGVPLQKMTSSDRSQKGIGWHRLGIDGNFPSSGPYKGRKQIGHGELWSDAYGKTCPENYASPKESQSRIHQVDDILAAAKGSLPPEPPTPSGDIAVDGVWGTETTSALQELFGTTLDGEVWYQAEKWKSKNPGLAGGWKWTNDQSKLAKGSPLIKAMQDFLNKQHDYKLKEDGLIGPDTIKAIQQELKYDGYFTGTVDGNFQKPSPSIKGMQTLINKRLQ